MAFIAPYALSLAMLLILFHGKIWLLISLQELLITLIRGISTECPGGVIGVWIALEDISLNQALFRMSS